MFLNSFHSRRRHAYVIVALCAAFLALTARSVGSQPEEHPLVWSVARFPDVAMLEDAGDMRAVWDSLASSDSPRGAVERLFGAYAHGWSREYRLMLTSDFHFVFAEAELRAQYPNGFTAEDERLSLLHLAHGTVKPDGRYLPPADAVNLVATRIEIGPDPEHPDDERRYALVRVGHASLQVMIGDGPMFPVFDGVEVMALVRGDAASIEPGQRADADHWYVRQWNEYPAGAPLVTETTTAGVVRR